MEWGGGRGTGGLQNKADTGEKRRRRMMTKKRAEVQRSSHLALAANPQLARSSPLDPSAPLPPSASLCCAGGDNTSRLMRLNKQPERLRRKKREKGLVGSSWNVIFCLSSHFFSSQQVLQQNLGLCTKVPTPRRREKIKTGKNCSL